MFIFTTPLHHPPHPPLPHTIAIVLARDRHEQRAGIRRQRRVSRAHRRAEHGRRDRDADSHRRRQVLAALHTRQPRRRGARPRSQNVLLLYGDCCFIHQLALCRYVIVNNAASGDSAGLMTPRHSVAKLEMRQCMSGSSFLFRYYYFFFIICVST